MLHTGVKNHANAIRLERTSIDMKYLILTFLFIVPLSAVSEERKDLRDILIGMSITELPAERYKNYSCVSDGKTLDSLNDFKLCPSGDNGLYEVGLEFDTTGDERARTNEKLRGTKIVGHPVIVSILIEQSGLIQGLRAVTDPEARAYIKRQAYLLSRRFKSRYGGSNWECLEKKPEDEGNKPIGKMFIDHHCKKVLDDKVITVISKIYREPAQTGKEMINSSSLEIISTTVKPE